jgi:hypothetical protein
LMPMLSPSACGSPHGNKKGQAGKPSFFKNTMENSNFDLEN